MKTKVVNPLTVRKGNRIVTGRDTTQIVQTLAPCETQPESVHINGVCYDSRFSSVTIKA